MVYFIFKTLASALVIAAISEIARRYTLIAGVIAAIPLTSILAFIWVYSETKDAEKIISLSYSIIWLVIPSLSFFGFMIYFLKKQVHFAIALPASIILMLVGYGVFLFAKNKAGY